jgi:hypothetical protein
MAMVRAIQSFRVLGRTPRRYGRTTEAPSRIKNQVVNDRIRTDGLDATYARPVWATPL